MCVCTDTVGKGPQKCVESLWEPMCRSTGGKQVRATSSTDPYWSVVLPHLTHIPGCTPPLAAFGDSAAGHRLGVESVAWLPVLLPALSQHTCATPTPPLPPPPPPLPPPPHPRPQVTHALWETTSISICSGCRNKNLQTKYIRQQVFHSTGLEDGNSISRCHRVGF